MLFGQGQKFLAAAVGKRAAGRVLVGGDRVKENGSVAGQRLCEGGQRQAIFIGRDRHGLEPVILLQDA